MARITGSTNRISMEMLSQKLDRIEGRQQEFMQSVADGSCPPFRDVREAVGAIEWLSENISSGKIDAIAGTQHINRLKTFIENQARANFSLFASSGRQL